MSELNIGKWYDPISQQWIEPREAPPVAPHSQTTAEKVLEIHRQGQTQRIWELLVDSVARS